ncbi:AaceriADL132Wp [[Ashbya] aceris (nom. inval.)]|nr:AaceriADL132Wp [[Ashbya] aceris (nom. inval.)]
MAVTTDGLQRRSDSDNCDGANCQKPVDTMNGKSLLIGVVVPVVVILVGMAIVMYKVWKKGKKEALEDDDPRFYGETEFLPDFHGASDVYPMYDKPPGGPPGGGGLDSLKPPGYAVQRSMSSQGSSYTSSPVDPFQLPEAMDDRDSLRTYARKMQTDADGYALASVPKGPPVSASPPPPMVRPYLESNGSFVTSNSRFDVDTALTQPQMDAMSTLQYSKQMANDPVASYSQYDPTAPPPARSAIPEAAKSRTPIQQPRETSPVLTAPLVRQETNLVSAHIPSEDSFVFEERQSIDNLGAVIKGKSSGNPTADVPETKSKQAIPEFSQPPPERPTNLRVQTDALPNGAQKAVSPQASKTLKFKMADDDETYATQMSPDDSNSIDRIKSIYQVYLDRNGTARRAPDFSDVDAQDLYSGPTHDAQVVKKTDDGANEELPKSAVPNHQSSAVQHKRAVSSIYSDGQRQQREFINDHDNHSAMPPLPQEFAHPQERENVAVLPSPSNLPESTTALSLTSFKKPTQARSPNIASLQQHNFSRPFNPVDHPEAFQHEETESQGLLSGENNGPSKILPHHLRQSVVMTHPMMLGQKAVFKPAGSFRQVSNERSNSLNSQGKPNLSNWQANSRVSGLLEFSDTMQPASVGIVLPSARSQNDLRKELEKSHNYSVI